MHAAMALSEVRQDLLWVGESAGSQWVRSRLWEVARTDLPVLILGEPGTGRRLAARLVHGVSQTPEAPFVRVDCGRLHAAQAEGVLFGGSKPGAFEQAEGGRSSWRRSRGCRGCCSGGCIRCWLPVSFSLPVNHRYP